MPVELSPSSSALMDAATADLLHAETSRSRNRCDFGAGDKVAALTESQSYKKFRYQRPFFRVLQLLARRNKSGFLFVRV
jgi:hypothetical protein